MLKFSFVITCNDLRFSCGSKVSGRVFQLGRTALAVGTITKCGDTPSGGV